MKKKKQVFSVPLFILLLVLATLTAILVVSASLRKINQEQAWRNYVPNPEGKFDLTDSQAIWLNQTVSPVNQKLVQELDQSAKNWQVLGETTEEKWIEVNLTEQKLKAHQGKKVVYEFLISSGKFAPTPVGEYRIWSKFKYTKMEGGIKGTGTYYYLSNVPYTMYFYNDFGLHGTYWHNNFGQPMSHGCVNLSIADSAKLFYWTDPVVPDGEFAVRSTNDNPGTRVVVHGRAPRG